jgi:hypothetical protein
MCLHVGAHRTINATTPEVPIHVVTDTSILRPGDAWSIEALEDVIGTPETYSSLTTRLFILEANLGVSALDIGHLEQLLTQYAKEHNLSIRVTYYPEGRPRHLNNGMPFKLLINHDLTGKRKRLTIDIWAKELLDVYNNNWERFRYLFNAMHIMLVQDQRMCGQQDYDTFVECCEDGALVPQPEANTEGTEYDFTVLRVHFVVDGVPQVMNYRLNTSNLPTWHECVPWADIS